MFQSTHSDFKRSTGEQTSLAEILSAFSYALDLTEGQPAGHSVRACYVGVKLAQAWGLNDTALRDIYYTVLLKDLGCSVNAARVTQMFVGNDRQLKHDFKLIGPDPEDFGAFIMANVGKDADAATRDAAVGELFANVGAIMTDIIDTRCTRGADIARQLRFSEAVANGIAHLDEHWDGSGLPSGVAGEAIHIGGRIALLAQIVDVFFTAHGPEAAISEVTRRSGTWLDPELVSVFLSVAEARSFWAALNSDTLAQDLFTLEPATQRVDLDEDYLDDIAEAFGRVIDAKSSFTGGHSERVGRYADAIAAILGFDANDRRRLRRAAILHDVGKLGVSSAILEKPGKLDADEWREMQSHASHTTHILSQIAVMQDMAMIAGSHHERLDGKGYPLGLDASCLSLESRIITVADFFDALTAERPYRAALPQEAALQIMAAEIGTAIDAECFDALKVALDRGMPETRLPTIPSHFQ
jgi:HD-GYP domain-containing protein (c-di-GMP phosphodiesterase class II)